MCDSPSIAIQLAERKAQGGLDGFGYYMFGIVLKEQGMKKDAMTMFARSVQLYPCHWGAWQVCVCVCVCVCE